VANRDGGVSPTLLSPAAGAPRAWPSASASASATSPSQGAVLYGLSINFFLERLYSVEHQNKRTGLALEPGQSVCPKIRLT
jgi:hypothetical protein